MEEEEKKKKQEEKKKKEEEKKKLRREKRRLANKKQELMRKKKELEKILSEKNSTNSGDKSSSSSEEMDDTGSTGSSGSDDIIPPKDDKPFIRQSLELLRSRNSARNIIPCSLPPSPVMNKTKSATDAMTRGFATQPPSPSTPNKLGERKKSASATSFAEMKDNWKRETRQKTQIQQKSRKRTNSKTMEKSASTVPVKTRKGSNSAQLLNGDKESSGRMYSIFSFLRK